MGALEFTSADTADEYVEARLQMVTDQLVRRGIRDKRVLRAMAQVPRHEFVARAGQRSAYSDFPLPIDGGQTISQPFTVAFMCEAARLEGNENILEVGAGSGYGAAVLARLGKYVHTLERISQLAHKAQNRLERLGYRNVGVHFANGALGLPEAAPFDAIVVTAGAAALPRSYIEQLAEGGRIVIPIGKGERSQTMYRFTLADGKLGVEDLGDFAFVPLIGDCGSDAESAQNPDTDVDESRHLF